MTNKMFTVTIETSPNPNFDLFAYTEMDGMPRCKSGTRGQVNDWIDSLDIETRAHGDSLEINDLTD